MDLVGGMPVHPLVVHGVVVLLPLAALASVLCTALPALRPRLPWAVGLDGLALVFAVVAEKSGEALQQRLSSGDVTVAAEHGEQAELVPLLALVLLVLTALALVVRSRPPLVLPAAGLVAVAAAGAVVVTVLAGHSGAVEVWGWVADQG